MANPLPYVPKKADPKTELLRRLDEAPMQHAEALLVAYDLLGEAHRQGILDALHGAVRARDTVVSELARYAADPVAINALRHVIAVGKMLGSFDPAPISGLAQEAYAAMETHNRETDAPSIWQLFRRLFHKDTRRGLAFLTSMLGALGRATR